ncbi:uncharacterized protein LOC121960213 isoform X1 [Plectropomus leopardus]|uniref:uncharacterized protein LOC121960213 isoform X1 n=1 Tax=Plectropomus leopardus TaxID=160734 RepID=UPI001C4C152D|nr:uncharacterized protein LOC121960213 isoform X1 [Plectropomus leopardus]
MGHCCNETHQNGQNLFCEPFYVQVLLGAISTILIFSLFWNIFCCASKCRSGKGRCNPRTRRRRSQRQMEDNPIYGNISYMQTSKCPVCMCVSLSLCVSICVNSVMLFSAGMTLFTGADSQLSSSERDHHRVSSDSQPKSQDCYANLTLKPPRLQSGRSSPQIQYSDVVHLEQPPESEKDDDGNMDALSCMSDLYASVQNQRTKTVDTVDSGEGYANHL